MPCAGRGEYRPLRAARGTAFAGAVAARRTNVAQRLRCQRRLRQLRRGGSLFPNIGRFNVGLRVQMLG